MTIGAILSIKSNIEEVFRNLKSLGLSHCQLGGSSKFFTDEMADRILEITKSEGIKITTFFSGWPGPLVWDFIQGPITIGVVPPEYRLARVEEITKTSDFAAKLGVNQVATHAGFIPESPSDPLYPGVVAALKYAVEHCKKNGQKFLFETGQETPVTLRRMIEDLGRDGIGINFDPANLLMYGKANPLDALDIIGEFILDFHAKDGEYPVNGRELGEEKPLGQGRVNFPVLFEKLKKMGYNGPVTIEREISGDQQKKDILMAIEILRDLI